MPVASTSLSRRYYPKLSEVMKVEDLPEFLQFAEAGLNAVFDKIHYKNFQYAKSFRGDGAFYSLDIVTKDIGLNLPAGFRFVLNPDEDGNPAISSFPVTLEYQWEILAFLKSFKLQSFSFTPEAFFDLGLKIFRVSEEEVIAHTLNYLVEPASGNIDKVQQVINDINALYPTAGLNLPAGETPSVSSLALAINQNPNLPQGASMLMFAAYIADGNLSASKQKLQRFFNIMVPGGIEEYVRQLIIPKAKASMLLSAAIEFPSTILRPVDALGTPIAGKTRFRFGEANLFVDTEGGIGFQAAVIGSLIPDFSEIGNTGILVQFTEARLDLSKKQNIPEADLAGYPVDFTGIYIQQVSLTFTKFGKEDTGNTSAKIFARELLIGSGGISGTIGLEANGKLYRKFGNNFAVELNAFELTFRHGSIVSSFIAGTLTIPRFKADGGGAALIGIQASILDNGDYNITALPLDNPYKLILPNVLELEVRSLSLGRRDDDHYIALAGTLNFIADIPVLGKVLPQNIEIYKLLVWDNGDIEFEGGSLVVPSTFKLNVGPVNLEVSHLSLGGYRKELADIDPVSQQRKVLKYNFFGFDGMINTGRAGVEATGNGIKYYFSTNHDDLGVPFDHFVRVDGIGIDLAVPQKNPLFLLNGYLSMTNPDPAISGSAAGTEYTGSVAFSMPKLRLSGSAGMRLNPSLPAFVVDIGLDLPNPIPIGGTGLGIYGFRGLIGQRYMPAKSAIVNPTLPESASWWEYYKAKQPTEGITIQKFATKSGFSVGAGASIATSGDSGKIFSSKLFLLLGLPDVFMIQGQAAILRDRIGLDDEVDPPFSALIIFGDKSIRGNLGVNYHLPEKGGFRGGILSLQGTLDMAFFFNNASGWYLNIGKDQPENERVRARVLSLFQGHAYLMLSMRGIKAGAGARFDFNKKFGPVRVGFGAHLNVGGFISFKPVQIGGYIQLGAYAYISVFGVKFGMQIGASLAAEAPHPFIITGSLELSFRVIKKFRIRIELTWRLNNNNSELYQPIAVLELPNEETGYLPAAAVNILSNEVFTINYVTTESGDTIPAPGTSWKYSFSDAEVIIPLDSFVDIELLKPVKPNSLLGGAKTRFAQGYRELIPPQKGVDRQVIHEFELLELGTYIWQPTTQQWVPYNIYEAVTAIVEANTGAGAVSLSTLKPGYWQFIEPNKFNKIRLLSQNMFSYASGATNSYNDLDARNFGRKDTFCFNNLNRERVINWKNVNYGTLYPALVSFSQVLFRFTHLTGRVMLDYQYRDESLHLKGNKGKLEIIFPEPLAYAELRFGLNSKNFKVKFATSRYEIDEYGKAIPIDEVLETIAVSMQQSLLSVRYNQAGTSQRPVQKAIVEFENPVLDYDGDLVIGGHYPLPEEYIVEGLTDLARITELDKAVQYVTLYNRSFTQQQIYHKGITNLKGIVAQWPLTNPLASKGSYPGVLMGSPDVNDGYYQDDSDGVLQINKVFNFNASTDALIVPYASGLKVENGSFSLELTAIFNPFSSGISTLLHKVFEDEETGERKGYALHLCQNTPGVKETSYSDSSSLPEFVVWFTCYSGSGNSGIQVTEKYTSECETGKLKEKQYKTILISVNRLINKLDIYIDKVLKTSVSIPAELSVTVFKDFTYLNEVRYLAFKDLEKERDNPITQEQFIDEIQMLDDGINKILQPVWRPNSTFAIKVKTMDRVNGNATPARTHIFGFRTEGPVGHFHQKNKKFQQLALEDRADEFKLASLKHYIDYERSFPDAQSRYDLSKPVFLEDPQIRLFFTKPYMNAMFSAWHSYQNLTSVESRLDLELINPNGQALVKEVEWESLPELVINDDSFRSLPDDLKIIYLLNKAASGDGCNANPISLRKRSKRGVYQFQEPLEASKLYTAVFKSYYKPAGESAISAEVHKFSFKTSRFANFSEQAGSFVLDDTPGQELYAVNKVEVSFVDVDINERLKPMLNDTPDDDPLAVSRFSSTFDRLVYGGLTLKLIQDLDHALITLIVNVNPSDSSDRRLLGILVTNPEPYNDPKLPEEVLRNTVRMGMLTTGGLSLGSNEFKYFHSPSTRAVFITNEAMNIPLGSIELSFDYKTFNGTEYDSESYTGPSIDLITPFNKPLEV